MSSTPTTRSANISCMHFFTILYKNSFFVHTKRRTSCNLVHLFRQTPSNNSGAPPVPKRDSSMRNSNGAQATVVQHQTIVTTVTQNSARIVNRFVMDIEAKFGNSFHNVTEFPVPQPFTKLEKSYPSRETFR